MSKKFKVVITDMLVEPLDCEREILGDIAEVIALNASHPSELEGKIEDADAMMVYHYLTHPKETLQRLKNCKAVVRPGVGYDNIDIAAAGKMGIPVCNVPDYGTEEVADSALGMALSLARGTHFLNSRLRRGIGEWNVNQATPIPRLRGKTFGIVGLGRIGSAAAVRAKSFGFNVVFYDPYVPDGLDKALGIRRADEYDELLEISHILSFHCPLTKYTRNMLSVDEIAKMQNGSFVVNTARGGVVDTEAVIDALKEGKLAGAGIDVLEKEPPEEESKIIQAWKDPNHPAHDRMILNPHTAFYCDEGAVEFRTKGSLEVKRALLGEPLRNRVN